MLRSTHADASRTTGSGKVASQIEIIEPQPSTVSNNNDSVTVSSSIATETLQDSGDNIDSSISLESNTNNTPRRHPSSISGSNERTPTRQRRNNRHDAVGLHPMSPPSNSQRRELNISQMFSGFDNVAK